MQTKPDITDPAIVNAVHSSYGLRVRALQFWPAGEASYGFVASLDEGRSLSRALHKISQWCRRNRHRPVRQQQHILSQKLLGHYAYYGITGNGSALAGFQHGVAEIWRKWLSRRRRGKPIPWKRFKRLLERYPLPPVRVVHSVYAPA